MYVTPASLAELPGARELSELASTEHDAQLVDPELFDLTLRGLDRSAYSVEDIAAADEALARVVAVVADADGLIDGFLRMRGYTLPLSPVPTIVANWSRSIARYMLHKSRNAMESTDPVVRDYNDAMKLLALVRDGKFSLGADDAIAPTGGGSPQFDAPERLFTRDTLADY
jgi:phage gp36-like protein